MNPISPSQPAMPEVALVLVGGLGTRLRPVVTGIPKALAPVAGKPFLHYLLTELASQGIQRVILCVGYMAEAVRTYARGGHAWGLEVDYSEERVALGTAGALRQASDGMRRAFFALNGDTLFRVDLAALWAQHMRVGGLATIALLRVAEDAAAARGSVRLSPAGRILAFDEKPGLQPSQPTWINGGVYVIEPQALADVPPRQAVSIERDVFPRLAAQGALAGCEQQAYFADIGTPDSLAAFERDVLDGKMNSPIR
jgi:NDP-sugar pyrophosphorylase family protein